MASRRGQHLIDQETFDKVQMLLDEKRVACERPRKRQHYLRGSVFCMGCGSRLTYGIWYRKKRPQVRLLLLRQPHQPYHL